LLNDRSKIRLYLGKHIGSLASCGIVFLDKNNVSGIHMIGTIPECRGLGLGKAMTNKLIFEAYENKSSEVVLVASKAGERIYEKLGFIAYGTLKSYSVKE
jgi:ribosomal protein S18 acetylase RimI-like enzyme